ncbi:unnamed protein product, partial [Rotaria socialis]
ILKKGQYVLRVTDKSGIFHIGHAADYAKKAEAYRKKTCAYIELDSDPLWSVFDKVILLLNGLRAKKHILSWQLDKMIPKREKVQLAYLYFIPKPHKIGTPLRPIVSSLHMPTTGISKFLDKLIRPLFDKYARSTTIIDGVDLIQRLEAYATNGYLNPTTYFCTFDITDLYIMLPQEESFDILTEFLLQYGYHKIQNIPIDAIRKLAPIVIKENGFPYENIFYRQVIGGALGSVFTLTLANILMWKWEKQLVHRLTISNEIYGRFGQSFSSKYQISTSYREKCIVSSYIFIDNQNGVLTTSVYHKAVAEPYIVPFKFGLPRHVFNNIIDTALLRVIRYSSVLSAFNEERQSIELMLLYNWYPPRYIHSRFHKFFARYLSLQTILPLLNDNSDLALMRCLSLNEPTLDEKKIAVETAQLASQSQNQELVVPPNMKQITAKMKRRNNLIIHQTYENGVYTLKRNIQQLWDRIYSKHQTFSTPN